MSTEQDRINAAVEKAKIETIHAVQTELRKLIADRSVPEIVVLLMASERIGMIGKTDHP